MDTTELSRHEAAAERCKMERWAVDFTPNTVRVVTTAGRVIGTFEQPEDAIAVCWLHEQQAALVAALTEAIKAREDACVAMERAQNHAADIDAKRHEMSRAFTSEMHDVRTTLNFTQANLDICQRTKNELETFRRAAGPLVDAVEKWTRDRHSPNLIAAWERFQREHRRGY